ncbi:MAG TPA: acyl-CoA dehydrogenase family protein [Streptosporangiaceae bacterium]|nr:acyl-CoA dehydrogenase family protein [Streptosporangiaceae bacterium]
MEFTDCVEQADLRSVVRAFAARHAPPDYDQKIWERLSTELGLTALAVPEGFGGAGAGPAEVAVAVEELGRVLLPSPYLSSAAAALALARAAADCPEPAERYLPGLAAGSMTGALALDADVTVDGDTITGVAGNVVDGAMAGLLLVRAGDDLVAVAATEAAVEPLATLDQTRGQAAIRLNRARAVPAGSAASAVALHRVLLAAECAAAAEYCLEVTVDYLKTRRQFGRPIGSFQALRHRAADLAVAVSSARATARAAVRTAAINTGANTTGDSDSAALAALAPLAALHCSRTFLQVTGEMIQLHGGIGFTWEHEAHRYFKRAKSSQLLLGPASALRAEIGRAAGLLPADPPVTATLGWGPAPR